MGVLLFEAGKQAISQQNIDEATKFFYSALKYNVEVLQEKTAEPYQKKIKNLVEIIRTNFSN
ncbi:MAG: hypothetical protein LBE12_02490 [Planctomycetaceae bacterium]|jgi:hypothetical protein|nr:hypothetical protein [Planctomycetaceae bacterium]